MMFYIIKTAIFVAKYFLGLNMLYKILKKFNSNLIY
jgi:hypothetical protein